MTFKKLISLCNPLDIFGPEPQKLGTLTQDSRAVQKNSVFIAIKGHQTDGHKFIDDAIARGAAVIISEKQYETDQNICILQVADTRFLIGPLAQAFENNPAKQLSIIGITGTNGKTTVATLVWQLLKQLEDSRPSLLGTVAKQINDEQLSSRLTTSDSIELARDMRRMVNAGSTHLVMEVSSHALEQQRVNGIHFEVGAFTNLSHDHLDYHGSIEAYAKAKKILFDELDAEAFAVINADDNKSDFIIEDCTAQILDFSFQQSARYECSIISNAPSGLLFTINDIPFETLLAGTFNAYNAAQAVLICHALGYEFDAIATALKSATGAPGRMERVSTSQSKEHPLILVDYAHTPDALKNVLSTLKEIKTSTQKLHVIFGCGGNRDKYKRPKMAAIAETYADKITVTSDNPRNEIADAIIDDIMTGFSQTSKVNRITDRRQAIEHVIAHAHANTIILIAGKGHETYQEVQGKRHHFDDREIARASLSKRNGNLINGEVH